jgi:hypothetical protein
LIPGTEMHNVLRVQGLQLMTRVHA